MKVISDGGMVSCNSKDTIDAIMLTKNIDYIDGIKLDVRISNDNILVLAENEDLNKFSLSNKKVSTCNYDYLKKIKFPSHIFKYYIPTLEEVLLKYNNEKIIVLELYNSGKIDILLKNLYHLLLKYSYKYYFMSKSNDVINKLKDNELNKIGTILLDNEYKIINDYQIDDEIPFDDDFFLITEYPEKIRKRYFHSTKTDY